MTAFIFDRWANFPPHASVLSVVLAVAVLLAVVLGYVVNAALRRRKLGQLGHLPALDGLSSSSPVLRVARPILVGAALVLLLMV